MALFERHVLPLGRDLLAHFPVVVIEGARQVGKSTLATLLCDDRPARTMTLDDVAVRAAAEADPAGFVGQFPDGVLVVDELQVRPDLIRAIKAAVDSDRRPGRFLLTGSANLLRLRGETDSLAGRAVTVRLRGLSMGEITGRRDDIVSALLDERFDPAAVTSAQTRADYVSLLADGSFPQVRSLPPRMRSRWAGGYLDRILERDAPVLAGGSSTRRLRTVATLLAANQSGELVRARLAEQGHIPPSSIGPYLDALDAIFLVDELPAWTPNLTHREVGRPKTLVADSMLAMHLARVTAPQLLDITATAIGGFVEAFVVEELLKQQTWSDMEFTLYHWRDRAGREVDVVAELADGRVVAFEVKSSATYKSEHFAGLRALRDRLGDRFVAGVVLGMADRGYRHDDRLWGMPISSLWEL